LCDFGISRIVEEGGRIREILGTPDYVAPEVLQFENLSLSTDIWSIGVRFCS
jgi:serine/threonine kinase 17